jgi:hypothetical protein
MSDGVITGVWISPDKTRVAIQIDGEQLMQVDTRMVVSFHDMLAEVDVVAHDWPTLYLDDEQPDDEDPGRARVWDL